MSEHANALVEVLLVEDNPGDVRLVREALRETENNFRLHVAQDGIDAMAFLRREGAYVQSPRPDLILLDLNLPRKDGREVLSEIKVDITLHSIPVVVFTTSEAEQDVLESYDLYANCYVTKPMDLDQYISVIRAIKEFWCNIVQLPEA